MLNIFFILFSKDKLSYVLCCTNVEYYEWISMRRKGSSGVLSWYMVTSILISIFGTNVDGDIKTMLFKFIDFIKLLMQSDR